MILLPYYMTEKKLPIGCTMTTLWLFLTGGGGELWKVDEEHASLPRETIVQEYLVENGLHGDLRSSPENYLVYKVDPKKTAMKDFHMWSDALEGQDVQNVWRPFFWLGASAPDNSAPDNSGPDAREKDAWGWKEEVDTLKVGFQPMGDIWKVLRDSADIL